MAEQKETEGNPESTKGKISDADKETVNKLIADGKSLKDKE